MNWTIHLTGAATNPWIRFESNQTLTKIKAIFLCGKTEFENLKFGNSEFENLEFENSEFENLEFEYSKFENFEFENSEFKILDFEPS